MQVSSTNYHLFYELFSFFFCIIFVIEVHCGCALFCKVGRCCLLVVMSALQVQQPPSEKEEQLLASLKDLLEKNNYQWVRRMHNEDRCLSFATFYRMDKQLSRQGSRPPHTH